MPNGYDKLTSALDRFQEAHFWLHMMEQHYHSADQFRWHLNVFMKALKEVPDLIAQGCRTRRISRCGFGSSGRRCSTIR